jgi:hypothetical protein
MSQTAKTSREAMKAKAKRLVSADPHTKVDSSDWTPPPAENASTQTGMRPLSKRAYKKGGKVIGKAEGIKAARRADRAPRKSGGKALTADSLINRNAKEANEAREGTKHIGGLKHGGRTHKFGGGMLGNNPIGQQNQMMGQAAGMRKHGGKTMSRRHREYGGADPIGAMIEANPEPMREMETLNAKSPQTEQAPPPEKKMPHKANPKGGLPGEKRGGRTDGHKVEWLHSKKSHHAHGGKAMHPDEAEDKKLIKKMVKPSALEHRAHKLSGGLLSRYLEKAISDRHGKLSQAGKQARAAERIYDSPLWSRSPNSSKIAKGLQQNAWDKIDKANKRDVGISLAKSKLTGQPMEQVNKQWWNPKIPEGKTAKIRATEKEPSMKHGGEVHHASCTCHKCWGGKAEKNKGGGVFKGEGYPFKVPGEVKGGRSAHAHGGKAGKGKMNVNIIIASGHHDKGAMGGQPMPNAPVSPRTPPVGAGMPMPPPGMMPPGGGAPGAGGPPMPPPGMMPRKSGGRTTYPIDSGAGGGEARLEKIKAYGLTPSRKK